MQQTEVLLMLTLVSLAKEGDKEAQHNLDAENKVRAQMGRPSVEEELKALFKKN